MKTPENPRSSNQTVARIGAIAFLLWGVLHIIGSGFVLAELASGGPAAGYGVYATPETVNAQIAGSVLGYMSFLILATGIVVAAIALRMGGTATGEHGIGVGKLDYMAAEHGEAWGIMADIKRTLDPGNILNPGKMVRIN